MQAQFRIMGSSSSTQLKEFLHAHIHQHSQPDIYIGTDSQNYANKTIYVSTVLLRYPKNGARVLYTKERLPQVKDLWSRLWNELERSIALAQHIENELGFTVKQIDMDYNSVEGFRSFQVYKAAKGYVESMGYKAKAKPELLMATWAANTLCN